jgi:hypothetical protein
MSPGSREVLLIAIAKPANGIDNLALVKASPRSRGGKEKPNVISAIWRAPQATDLVARAVYFCV